MAAGTRGRRPSRRRAAARICSLLAASLERRAQGHGVQTSDGPEIAVPSIEIVEELWKEPDGLDDTLDDLERQRVVTRRDDRFVVHYVARLKVLGADPGQLAARLFQERLGVDPGPMPRPAIVDTLRGRILARQAGMGEDAFRSGLKDAVLDAVDDGWSGQLEKLYGLQQVVGFMVDDRQKPEVEYSLQAFRGWNVMEEAVEDRVLKNLLAAPAAPAKH